MKIKNIQSLFAVCILSLFFYSSALAQENTPAPNQPGFWENVRYGGGFGLNFGAGNFQLALSPSAIYDVNKYLSFGPALNFSYQSSEFFKSTLYGASAIVLVNPIQAIQLSGELEQLRVNNTIETSNGDVKDNFWNTALFLGGGFRSNNVTIGARYNVLYNNGDGVYADAWQPFIRIYF
jgi:long-subunit fatty acid transport protein